MKLKMKVVGVTLKERGKIYYFLPNNNKITKNKKVVIESEFGNQLGEIVKEEIEIQDQKIEQNLKKIIRIATQKDIEKYNKNQKDALNAIKKAKKIALKLNIDLKIIDAFYTLDRKKLVFRFLSDTRVDFRELVKELAYIYKTRIELKQLGARDKAKEIGGCGECGRQLCCSSFLKKIDSVSINNAKTQNLALNPSKINGVCGRLLCCLKYENDCYKCALKNMSKIGDEIKVDEGTGKVISLDILNRKYKVFIENVGIVEVKLDEQS